MACSKGYAKLTGAGNDEGKYVSKECSSSTTIGKLSGLSTNGTDVNLAVLLVLVLE